MSSPNNRPLRKVKSWLDTLFLMGFFAALLAAQLPHAWSKLGTFFSLALCIIAWAGGEVLSLLEKGAHSATGAKEKWRSFFLAASMVKILSLGMVFLFILVNGIHAELHPPLDPKKIILLEALFVTVILYFLSSSASALASGQLEIGLRHRRLIIYRERTPVLFFLAITLNLFVALTIGYWYAPWG